MSWLSFFIIFLCSFALTGLIRHFCVKFDIVDHPCERRTHSKITPRGGGLAIVLTFFAFIFYFHLPVDYYVALLPGLIIAIMGFWDDVKSLSARFRLSMQLICAMASILILGNLKIVEQILRIPLPTLACFILIVLFIVWSTNLYNFMDGINGLAAMEALCLSGFMGVLAYNAGQIQLSCLWFYLTFSSMGFLIWNFPHAKIFLGDTGSHFFGFTFSILLLKVATINIHWFWGGLIVLGYFVTDATLTLIVRVWNKFSFLEPHRTHAYQLFWKKWNGNHAMVTLFIFLLNIFWLMPWAWVVSNGLFSGFWGLVISYLPLFFLVWHSRAGRKEQMSYEF